MAKFNKIIKSQHAFLSQNVDADSLYDYMQYILMCCITKFQIPIARITVAIFPEENHFSVCLYPIAENSSRIRFPLQKGMTEKNISSALIAMGFKKEYNYYSFYYDEE